MPRGLSRSLHPVNSIKHVVDTPSSAVLAVTTVVPVAQAVDSPVLTNVVQIKAGSVINSIFLRVEVLATNVFGGIPRLYFAVQKNPGGNLGNVQPNSVGDSDIKKFIIHQEMVMVSNLADSGFPRTVFVGVIKLPQRYRRFGVRDELTVNLQNGAGETTGINSLCVQCIYKEIF